LTKTEKAVKILYIPEDVQFVCFWIYTTHILTQHPSPNLLHLMVMMAITMGNRILSGYRAIQNLTWKKSCKILYCTFLRMLHFCASLSKSPLHTPFSH
jgi:hypothetical protein